MSILLSRVVLTKFEVVAWDVLRICFDNCSRHLLLHLPRSKLLIQIEAIWSVNDKTKNEKE